MGTLRFTYDTESNQVSLLSKHHSKDFQTHGLQAIAASVVIFYAEKADCTSTSPWQEENHKDIPASLSMIPAPSPFGAHGQHPSILREEHFLTQRSSKTGGRISQQDICQAGTSEVGEDVEDADDNDPASGDYDYSLERESRHQMSGSDYQRDHDLSSPSSSVEFVDNDQASMLQSSAPVGKGFRSHLDNGVENTRNLTDFDPAVDPSGSKGNQSLNRAGEFSGGNQSIDHDRDPLSLHSGLQEDCVCSDGSIMQLQPSLTADGTAVANGDVADKSIPCAQTVGSAPSAECDMDDADEAEESEEIPVFSFGDHQDAGENEVPVSFPSHTLTSSATGAPSGSIPSNFNKHDPDHSHQLLLNEYASAQAQTISDLAGNDSPYCPTMTATNSEGESKMYGVHVADRTNERNATSTVSKTDGGTSSDYPVNDNVTAGESGSVGAHESAKHAPVENMMHIDLTDIKMEPVDTDLIVETHMMPPVPSSNRRRHYDGSGYFPMAMPGFSNSGGVFNDTEFLAARLPSSAIFRMPAQVGRSMAQGQMQLQQHGLCKISKDSPKQTARMRKTARCALCHAGICSLMDYLNHLQIHRDILENGINFSCPVCLKSSQSYLEIAKVHVAVHIDKDSHTCPICGTQIIRKDALKRHFMLLHPNNMEDFATYSLQLSRLMNEVWKRHAVKPQPSPPAAPSRQVMNLSTTCFFCRLTIDSKDDFMTHVEMHSCLSPVFKCPICLQLFSTRCHLTRHAACHLTKEWVCPLCYQTFARSDSFKRHLRNMHSKV